MTNTPWMDNFVLLEAFCFFPLFYFSFFLTTTELHNKHKEAIDILEFRINYFITINQYQYTYPYQ